ncbi:hypothetical protein SIID45300_00414 [Candidatus Magnetaquicoccaceae bacterium FCR-1]|uniref:Uncharacterized protein n=1 Tax=Candidatus Magnetaquiglobus chichijimensis TaxID=3141448 RepID=A0ABQ0C5D9_9PROT
MSENSKLKSDTVVMPRVRVGRQVTASSEWRKPMTEEEFADWMYLSNTGLDPSKVTPRRAGRSSLLSLTEA